MRFNRSGPVRRGNSLCALAVGLDRAKVWRRRTRVAPRPVSRTQTGVRRASLLTKLFFLSSGRIPWRQRMHDLVHGMISNPTHVTLAIGLALSSAKGSQGQSEASLKGKRVAILATDGFEQAELTEPRKALD